MAFHGNHIMQRCTAMGSLITQSRIPSMEKEKEPNECCFAIDTQSTLMRESLNFQTLARCQQNPAPMTFLGALSSEQPPKAAGAVIRLPAYNDTCDAEAISVCWDSGLSKLLTGQPLNLPPFMISGSDVRAYSMRILLSVVLPDVAHPCRATAQGLLRY